MTKEVGAITGRVEVWTHDVIVRIRYAEADDVYTVAGDLQSMTLAEVSQALQFDPGSGNDGNAKPVDLDSRRDGYGTGQLPD